VRTIVDYNVVLERLQSRGLVCNYYNGGAFGFPPALKAQTVAWIGPPDETIRAEARQFTRQVPEPYEPSLASLATKFWQQLAVPAWVMPMSHWAFELDHGNHQWLPGLLEAVGVSAGELQPRTNAAAIEFPPDDPAAFRLFVQGLLTNLGGSDFAIVFPDRAVVCIIHHHKQLWWTTTEPALLGTLDQLMGTAESPIS